MRRSGQLCPVQLCQRSLSGIARRIALAALCEFQSSWTNPQRKSSMPDRSCGAMWGFDEADEPAEGSCVEKRSCKDLAFPATGGSRLVVCTPALGIGWPGTIPRWSAGCQAPPCAYLLCCSSAGVALLCEALRYCSLTLPQSTCQHSLAARCIST